MDMQEMVAKLRESGALQKVASQEGLMGDSAMEKLAENLEYSGRIFGHAVVTGILEKMADVAAGATGKAEPSQGDKSKDQSNFKRVADKIMGLKGIVTPGSVPGIAGKPETVVRETVATPGDKTRSPNPDDRTG